MLYSWGDAVRLCCGRSISSTLGDSLVGKAGPETSGFGLCSSEKGQQSSEQLLWLLKM